MRSKFCVLTIIALALVGLCASGGPPPPPPPPPSNHHEHHRVEIVNIPNRIAWLPAGTEIVMRFLINVSDSMIQQYSLALARIKKLRETLRHIPPGYRTIDLFYDNDIQHPSHPDAPKPLPIKASDGDAFKSAFETIQNFAGKRVSSYGKH